MNKLELYGIALAVLLMAIGGAYGVGHFKGRAGALEEVRVKQLKADNAELQGALDQTAGLARKDNEARAASTAYIETITKGLEHVRTKYASLPSVVVDPNGCDRLSAAFWLRWSETERLQETAGGSSAGRAGSGVPIDPVPPAR